MKGEDFLELLKWVGLVFAAGFIGYFGRSLAKKILQSSKKSTAIHPSDPQLEKQKAHYKLEKKKLKLKEKDLKKK